MTRPGVRLGGQAMLLVVAAAAVAQAQSPAPGVAVASGQSNKEPHNATDPATDPATDKATDKAISPGTDKATDKSTDPRTGKATDKAADRLVDVAQVAAGLRVELRYATANNFTKHVIYPPSARCYLRAPVAARLAAVHRLLQARGLGLKVYDCYRPRSAQQTLWDIVPDERYVANPKSGSRHNRGAAVDLTLVDRAGRELPMPTPYDDFTVKAHRTYQALPAVALRNRDTLEQAMVAQGFAPLPTEWWHFDDPDSHRYPMTDISFDALLTQK